MKRSALVTLLTAALLAGGLVAEVSEISEASEASEAATQPAAACTAADTDVYTPPATVPATPGTVLACRSVTLSQVPGGIPTAAWKLLYSSTDNQGRPAAVSGTLAVPTAPWTGTGARPVVAFHPGTLGLGPQCAFSKQLAGAFQDEYEGDNIAALLKAGYAVAATDGPGYLDGRTHRYVAGTDSGHALLDIARAAPAVPGSGLSRQAKVGLWGYSEGGAASLWAAQLAAGYAPELNVVGDASGGVPATSSRWRPRSTAAPSPASSPTRPSASRPPTPRCPSTRSSTTRARRPCGPPGPSAWSARSPPSRAGASRTSPRPASPSTSSTNSAAATAAPGARSWTPRNSA